MAEEKKEQGKEDEGKEGKDGKATKAPNPAKKKMIMIAVILVVDLAIMAGAAFFIVGKLKGEEEVVAEDQKKVQEEEELKAREALVKIGHTLPKPIPFTVNIASSTPEQSHYLKCAIQFEWEEAHKEGEEHAAAAAGGGGHGGGGEAGPTDPLGMAIVERMPKITDIVINVLSSMTYEELLLPSGKQKIKESIVTEINAILPTEHGHIKNIFFTEFIVQ